MTLIRGRLNLRRAILRNCPKTRAVHRSPDISPSLRKSGTASEKVSLLQSIFVHIRISETPATIFTKMRNQDEETGSNRTAIVECEKQRGISRLECRETVR
jgi:hypothetical protein